MRTTLTLDDDVAAMLKRMRAESSGDYRQLVNHLLRNALQQAAKPKQPREPYRTPSTDAGRCKIGSIADIQHVLSEAEGPLNR
jgi:hypothetical protein